MQLFTIVPCGSRSTGKDENPHSFEVARSFQEAVVAGIHSVYGERIFSSTRASRAQRGCEDHRIEASMNSRDLQCISYDPRSAREVPSPPGIDIISDDGNSARSVRSLERTQGGTDAQLQNGADSQHCEVIRSLLSAFFACRSGGFVVVLGYVQSMGSYSPQPWMS